MNLKCHKVGRYDQHEVYGPADIEGHESDRDGCFYLLDFARTMPPQVNVRSDKQRRHLFELLRPELVKSAPTPLSSDALCAMGKWDDACKIHNKEV